ncbi:MAG TPA: DNA polymerase III subunit chi [Burkholderiaceae bacterium]
MTRIDFHSNVPDKLDYTCRLVRKAYNNAAQCVILAEDAAQMAQLDEALWTFSKLDFIPHVAAGSELAPVTPVIVCADALAELPHHQVLINLTGSTPPHFARFERLLEIVSTEAADVAAGRERYAFYKRRGYPLEHRVYQSAA